MTTQTQTLADFLLARIAEDEAVAREPEVYPKHKDFEPWELFTQEAGWGLVVGAWGVRVLAECESKRRIVERVQANDGVTVEDDWALNLLALPYADHPDFRPEWRL